MKKFLKFILPALTLVPVAATISLSSCSKSHLRLARNDWEDHTKTALNDCIANYGIDGKYYSKDNYVIFDFDNTSAIFDIAHQCTNYQIEHMCYNLTPTELFSALSSDLNNIDLELERYGFTYRTLINEIVDSYTKLVSKYGQFTYKGIDESKLSQLHEDDDWIDFSAKLRYMTYSVVADIEGDKNRCKWGTYLFANMTPDQVYELEYNCLSYYSKIESYEQTWTSKTKIGTTDIYASSKFTQGISVTDNIRELYKTINDNGIDIWIISASQIDQVKAAADVFGVSQYIRGCYGLTNKLGDDGKYIAAYDVYGKGYLRKDNKWYQGLSNNNFTSGIGKSLTIRDVIAPYYHNHGPIMCFGDSTGDFNFCTEFKDTKLVVCFNRADRSVTDGGGLMSAIAMYQQNKGMTLAKANENGDTLYCLQGRDEHGLRSFRNSNKTIRLDSTEEQLFKNSANDMLLAYINDNNLSIADACNLCIKRYISGIEVGFLTQYDGYHSR